MIKFFRHTRQQLVMENKNTKYFKYAIGEIVLVVIGILIALQINNWNDNNRETIQLHEYLTKVRNDIQLDIVVIDSLLTKRTRIQKNCELLIGKIMQNKFDLSQNFLASEALDDSFFNPNESGYEALKNSSYLGKISGTKVDKRLDNYNNLVKQIVNEEEGFFAYIESMETIWTSQVDLISLMKLYPLTPNEALEYFETSKTKNSDLYKNVKDAFNKTSYIAVVTRTAGQTAMLKHYSQLIEEGQKTIKEINNYIDD